jgi:hypothetical protein
MGVIGFIVVNIIFVILILAEIFDYIDKDKNNKGK